MARFDIKIRISAKDYFDMTARYLPFQLMTIEELPDLQLPKAPPAVVAMANAIKARHEAKLKNTRFDSVAKVRKNKRIIGVDTTHGMAQAIMNVLDDGQTHTTSELIRGLQTSGFKPTSINSLVVRMVKFNHIARIRPGHWRKVEHHVSHTQEAERVTRAVSELDPEGIPEA